MSDADDNLNKTIEDNLRQAHQQVHCRPEWAAQLLGQITQELEQNRSIDRPLETLQTVGNCSKRSWSKVNAVITGLAAGLLLAVLGSVFLARSMNRNETNAVAKKIANNRSSEFQSHTAPLDIARPNKDPTEPQSTKSKGLASDSVTDDSVTAGTGYLATKLSSEAEFEIYVVLPTLLNNVARNTN